MSDGQPPVIDPLAGMEICPLSFDIEREVSVYPDNSGDRWWTKAWFNNDEHGESAVEIDRETALDFMHDRIALDAMLEAYYPKQMEIYHNVMQEAKDTLLNQMRL